MAIHADWKKLEERLEEQLTKNDVLREESLYLEKYELLPEIISHREEILRTYRKAALNYKDWTPFLKPLYESLGYKPIIK